MSGIIYPIALVVEGRPALSPTQIRQSVIDKLDDSTVFPTVEVLYRKVADKLMCSNTTNSDAQCLNSTVTFFNVDPSKTLPDSVVRAIKLVYEALKESVPSYLVYLTPVFVAQAFKINNTNGNPKTIPQIDIIFDKRGVEGYVAARFDKFKTELDQDLRKKLYLHDHLIKSKL